MTANLEFAAKRRAVKLSSNVVPTPEDLLTAAFVTVTGDIAANISNTISPAAPGILGSIGDSYPAQQVKAFVSQTSSFLGAAGPLVGGAGLWLIADVLSGLFSSAPTISDREILSRSRWRQLGNARSFVLDQIDSHGWAIGGRIAGEVLAAAGAVIGRKGIANLGSVTGAELWISPSGNFALVISQKNTIDTATIRQLVKAEGHSAPDWMGKEFFSVDLGSGAIYQNGRDLVLMAA